MRLLRRKHPDEGGAVRGGDRGVETEAAARIGPERAPGGCRAGRRRRRR
jgi:hypothetical protein